MEENRFIKRYRDGDIPWYTGRPDYNLINMVKEHTIEPCKTLELGCGTGDNSFWLSESGFLVSAFDLSEIAINQARKQAESKKLNINFFVADIFKDKIQGSPFDFIFDRGVFHSFDEDIERKNFAEKVNENIAANGLWLSLIGSADGTREGQGPPTRSALNVVKAIEPYFKIISIESGHFDSLDAVPAKIWICLMQKR